MTERPPCGRCGRSVPLWGRSPEGRICRNCMAIRNSAVCGHCSEFRRVDGRDPDGVVWCARCRQRQRGGEVDADRRRRIMAAVDAADPSLARSVVGTVLEATVRSRRSLRRLADHLHAHPRRVRDGPDEHAADLGPLHDGAGGGGRHHHHHHPSRV
ncbi:MAG: hypothetical protein ACRD0U_01385 [Acidimicrobiales bacterium]